MRSLLLLAGFVALAGQPALAEDTPCGGSADPRVKFVEYQETQVYRIVGTFRTATQIVLGADETIQHVALGDTVSWKVAVAGYILFLKPRERAGPTNLILTTNRGGELRNYAFGADRAQGRDQWRERQHFLPGPLSLSASARAATISHRSAIAHVDAGRDGLQRLLSVRF